MESKDKTIAPVYVMSKDEAKKVKGVKSKYNPTSSDPKRSFKVVEVVLEKDLGKLPKGAKQDMYETTARALQIAGIVKIV